MRYVVRSFILVLFTLPDFVLFIVTFDRLHLPTPVVDYGVTYLPHLHLHTASPTPHVYYHYTWSRFLPDFTFVHDLGYVVVVVLIVTIYVVRCSRSSFHRSTLVIPVEIYVDYVLAILPRWSYAYVHSY